MRVAAERWKPVPGYEGFYEVSSHGRVRSLPRQTVRGMLGGRILKQQPLNKWGHLSVCPSVNGHVTRLLVHRLVMLAFVGPCPAGQEVRHLDGNPANNRWAPGDEKQTRKAGGNLIYGTKRANNLDAVQHGTHWNARKTHCPKKHKYTPENTYLYYRPERGVWARTCKTCLRERRRKPEAA